MKLKEEVFMLSLIQANYCRRMLVYKAWLAVFLISIFVVIFNEGNNLTLISSISLIVVVFSVVLFSLMFFVEVRFPWVIKKEQIRTLRQQVEAEANFEDLRSQIPLKEYFLY